MPQLSWEEISSIIHQIKRERTILRGVTGRIRLADASLKKIEENLMNLVEAHREEST